MTDTKYVRSWGHRCHREWCLFRNEWRYHIGWLQRPPHTSQRLAPADHRRIVGEAAARRFCRKWGINFDTIKSYLD